MIATVANVILVLVGSALGLLFRRFIRESIISVLTHALGLCVAGVGISSLMGTQDMLCAIVCMVVGTVIGQGVDIEARLERGGEWLRQRVDRGNPNSRFTESFVSAALLFCVGAMAIVGSLQDGLTGDHTTLFAKSLLDGISAVVFASSLGIGVAFSAAAVFLYQGAIALMASFISPFLGEAVIAEMTCVGSLLIIALALNMLGITKIKVMNLVPACILPIFLCMVM